MPCHIIFKSLNLKLSSTYWGCDKSVSCLKLPVFNVSTTVVSSKLSSVALSETLLKKFKIGIHGITKRGTNHLSISLYTSYHCHLIPYLIMCLSKFLLVLPAVFQLHKHIPIYHRRLLQRGILLHMTLDLTPRIIHK